jgi:hypothetical protein
MQQRNGAGQTESDPKSTSFFPFRLLWPGRMVNPSARTILAAAAHSDHPIIETRNAD